MLGSIILFGLLAILSFLYLYIQNSKKYWQSRGVLTKPAHIILGHFKGIGTSVHIVDRLTEFYNEFKGKDKFCGIYTFNRPVALITDLDLVRDICIKDFNNFHDRGMYVNEEADPLTANLFGLAGSKWKMARNKLSPTFTSGKLKLMYSTVVGIANYMDTVVEQKMKTDKTFDIKRLCDRYVTDVIASAAFGLDSKTLDNEDAEILKMIQIIFRPSLFDILRFTFLTSYHSIGHKLGLKLLPDNVTKYFMNVLRETVDNREKSDVKRNDFIDILIKMKNSGVVDSDNSNEEANFVGKITFNELAAHSFIFFFAGAETTAISMAFALFQLALNQDIQDRVRAEILSVLKKHDNQLTYEAVIEMTYLGQCLDESLRIFTPAHTLFRETLEDYKVSDTNHILEKGTQILIPLYCMHRDENIYPEPLKFDPDRFLPENTKTRHPYAFLPFGEGPRICIGKRFALLQTKVGLASLLSKLRVTVNEKTQLPYELEEDNQQLAIKGGIWLDMEKV